MNETEEKHVLRPKRFWPTIAICIILLQTMFFIRIHYFHGNLWLNNSHEKQDDNLAFKLQQGHHLWPMSTGTAMLVYKQVTKLVIIMEICHRACEECLCTNMHPIISYQTNLFQSATEEGFFMARCILLSSYEALGR